jgi:hypothetical protein
MAEGQEFWMLALETRNGDQDLGVEYSRTYLAASLTLIDFPTIGKRVSPLFAFFIIEYDSKGHQFEAFGQVRLFESDDKEVSATERMLKQAHSILNATKSRRQACGPILKEPSNAAGFPTLLIMAICMGDYLHNGNYSVISLFTTNAHYYNTIKDSNIKPTRELYQNIHTDKYPHKAKIRKLVWREVVSADYTDPRARIGRFAVEHHSSEILDKGLYSNPNRQNVSKLNITRLSGRA